MSGWGRDFLQVFSPLDFSWWQTVFANKWVCHTRRGEQMFGGGEQPFQKQTNELVDRHGNLIWLYTKTNFNYIDFVFVKVANHEMDNKFIYILHHNLYWSVFRCDIFEKHQTRSRKDKEPPDLIFCVVTSCACQMPVTWLDHRPSLSTIWQEGPTEG